MKFNELSTNRIKQAKRLGRGIASGHGKTAGRGTKGQRSRTGSSAKPGFSGGQNPLMQKLPKLPGFRSHRTPMENVYTGQLEALGVKTVDTQVLSDNKLISNPFVAVKLISKGEVTKPVTVELQGSSRHAVEQIEKAGGTFKVVPRVARPAKAEKSES